MNSLLNDANRIDEKVRSSAEAELTKITDSNGLAYELEKAKCELDSAILQKQHLEEELNNKKQDRELRKKYADMIFRYLLSYSIFCAVVLLSQAIVPNKFSLPDNVLVALVGGTAVAVVGLVGWVVRGLFKPPPEK